MFRSLKGQTSLEFLMILLFLIIIGITVTFYLTSTFDINTSIYKTKNRTLELIAVSYTDMYIQNISYGFQGTESLTLNVFLRRHGACPGDLNYFNDHVVILKTHLEDQTQFDEVNINFFCNPV